MFSLGSFWYGSYDVKDVEWLINACSLLRKNEWKDPLLFDGSGWYDPHLREEATIALLEALRDNSSATSFTFRNGTLDLKALRAFNEILDQNTHLQAISLRNLKTTTTTTMDSSSGSMVLPIALFHSDRLVKELTLERCTLDDAGCKALGQMIRTSSSLETLSFASVDIKGSFSAIAESLTACTSLKHLTLRDMTLSAADMRKLLRSAAGNTSLESLSLQNLQIGMDSANELAFLLAQNNHLKSLSLCKNNLDGDAIQIMVRDGLQTNNNTSSLEKLVLSHNPIGDDGAQHLVPFLQTNITLRELSLICTEVWHDGCLALIQGLPHCHGLRQLALDGNDDVEECAEEILQALQENMVIYQILESLPRRLLPNNENVTTWKEIDYLLRLNKANRRVLAEPSLPVNLIPNVLQAATAQPDLLYHLIRHMPTNVVVLQEQTPPKIAVVAAKSIGGMKSSPTLAQGAVAGSIGGLKPSPTLVQPGAPSA